MRNSLQRIFVLPFIVLMLVLAAMMAWVVHSSSESLSDAAAQKILTSLSARVQSEVDRHLSSAQVILNAIAPDPVVSPDHQFFLPLNFPEDLGAIEERLWIATGLFPDINNLAYFAGENGSFVSVKRLVLDARVEVRYRQAGEKTSDVFSMSGPRQRIALLRSDQFDPKQRPWYKTAITQTQPSWSPVYIDFTKKEPLLTLSKAVIVDQKNRQDVRGVVATDLSLKQISSFLQALPIPKGGIAYVMEASDELIASSLNEIAYVRNSDNTIKRQLASEGSSALMHLSARHVRQAMLAQLSLAQPVLQKIDSDLDEVHIAATLLKAGDGLHWVAVLAVPRSALSVEVARISKISLMLGLAVIFGILIAGYLILTRSMRDLRKLSEAAQSIGSGLPFKGVEIHRNDEIGVLAQSFQNMEQHLHFDTLTKLLNREAFISQLSFRSRRATDGVGLPFALLFIDLDSFKEINDNYGHEAGDKVLIEIASRLLGSIRKEDAAGRFGGDEFAVYLHGVAEPAILEQICAKLHKSLEAPIALGDDRSGAVGISIGIALYPVDGVAVDELLHVADMRMFEDKKRRKAEREAH
ncbi:diguanylate cyclase [Undibacterium sp.]|uniref:diguanylate cyclase domain-containing protein n=1 Tax=Undibacterium sp. TaxID=1914977 RepID=UPI0025EC4AA7|nr:diguanylate cyclase [Undibacterium sp.]